MKQFTALIKNQFNFRVGTYHSDEGGEYSDRGLLKILKDLGIDIQEAFHMLANKMVELNVLIRL